jgi:YidC/Oxa1 family membrane protein insertase
MDKNTITGLVLIAIVVIGFSFFSRPSKEQQMAQQRFNDSIARIENQKIKQKQATAKATEKPVDSIATVDAKSPFFAATKGTEQNVVLQNKKVRLYLSSKGGYITDAIMKDYKAQDRKSPVTLFSKKDVAFNCYFYNADKVLQTKNMYFTVVSPSDSMVTMRLATANADKQYIDFIYRLRPESYMVDLTVKAVGMDSILTPTVKYMDMEWSDHARQQERGFMYENRLATLTYRTDNDSKNLSASREDEKTIDTPVTWIAYKNQFFSAVLISDQMFSKCKLSSKADKEGTGYLKAYAAEMNTKFDPTGKQPTTLHFFLGPNHFHTLSSFNSGQTTKWHLEDLVYLGWPVVKQINQWFTIPIFDWLRTWGLSMGWILLILTLIVKMVVYPATWKTYISSAKMRVLKPKIDEINAKYPNKEDAMKKQQEVMSLYSQYGVSPMGGCLPMLIQFPILMALFMFLPSAIELRQQSFLWADDLSTYDAIINFPFHIPFLGSHLSLFCVLMTTTNMLYTSFTMKQQDTGANPQMAAMKWMTYLMPLMFFFLLNDYPSGLNYYYFLSTLIAVVTMILMKKMTNEDKLLAQLEAHKKTAKKKSGFAARLEAMQKESEDLRSARAKRDGRR